MIRAAGSHRRIISMETAMQRGRMWVEKAEREAFRTSNPWWKRFRLTTEASVGSFEAFNAVFTKS